MSNKKMIFKPEIGLLFNSYTFHFYYVKVFMLIWILVLTYILLVIPEPVVKYFSILSLAIFFYVLKKTTSKIKMIKHNHLSEEYHVNDSSIDFYKNNSLVKNVAIDSIKYIIYLRENKEYCSLVLIYPDTINYKRRKEAIVSFCHIMEYDFFDRLLYLKKSDANIIIKKIGKKVKIER